MVKVLISDNLSPRAADIFRDRGIDVDVDTKLTPEQLLDRIGDYEGLAVRSATKATAAVLAAAGNLKVIGRAGIRNAPRWRHARCGVQSRTASRWHWQAPQGSSRP